MHPTAFVHRHEHATRQPLIRPRRKPLHGFTLIELLVVISIIALLIGILLPALGAARGVAQAAVCGSNLRQMGIGWTNYAADHAAIMPGADFSVAGPPYYYWWGEVNAAGDVAPNTGFISDYIPHGTADGCPTWHGERPAWAGETSYGYNWVYFAGPGAGVTDVSPQLPINMTDMRQPTKTVVFADSAQLLGPDEPLTSNAYLTPTPGDNAYLNQQPSFFHGRHRDHSGKIVWADGHVSTDRPFTNVSAASAFDPAVLEARHIGFIESDDDYSTDELYDFE